MSGEPTVAAALAHATAALAAAGVCSPGPEARWLMRRVLAAPAVLPSQARLPGPAAAELGELLARRCGGEPLQHILGTAAFRHLELAVGPGVFVPRPETELMVDLVIDTMPNLALEELRPSAPRVVDLCSGSGALALALAQELPQATVWAVERAPAAVTWLRRNAAARAQAGDRPVRIVEADIADAAALRDLATTMDVVVCNPPYVPDAAAVSREVAHDPKEAVFAGPDGLDVIRVLAPIVAGLLAPGGLLVLEHDESHQEAAADLLRRAGLIAVHGHQDLAGRPRFLSARRPASGRMAR